MIKLYNGKIISKNQFSLVTPPTEKIPKSFKTVEEYNQYLLSSIQILYEDNLFLYQIPSSFVVYSDKKLISEVTDLYLNTVDVHSKIVYKYTFVEPIHLVALDHYSNLDVLIASSIKNRLVPMDKIIQKQDGSALLEQVCAFGLKGYIIKFADSKPYIINLCSPEKYLQPNPTVQPAP
jgi:hypothetical protein